MASFSTIVPCYNQARFLAQAIESALNQMSPPAQVVVVDDGSTDKTAEVAGSFGGRVLYVWQSNKGLSAARNTGLSHAAGEFVHFLDADDFVLPGFYETVVGELRRHPRATAAFSGWTMVNEDGSPRNQLEVESGHNDWFHFMLERCLCPCHALVFRRSIFEQAGNFDETLQSCEDWEMWLRIAASGAEFLKVPGFQPCYRLHNEAMSMNHKQMLQSGYRIIRSHAKHHGQCRQCRASSRRGLANFSHYVWNLTQRGEMRRMLEHGRLFAYLARAIRQSADDGLWLKWSAMNLLHSKRLLASAWLRPLGVNIAPRRA